MKRFQLEHVLRAAAGITGGNRFVVIGSQALLGQYVDPPGEFLVSLEADIYSPRDPREADLIDGSIGEGSPFHQTFGYYAHGVGEETAVLPAGWKDRLVPLESDFTGGAMGLCLEVHDLAISKLVAGRSKDMQFVADLLRHGMANRETLRKRLSETTLEEHLRAACAARLNRVVGDSSEIQEK